MFNVIDKRKKIVNINDLYTNALKIIIQRRNQDRMSDDNTSYSVIGGYSETTSSNWSSTINNEYPTGD